MRIASYLISCKYIRWVTPSRIWDTRYRILKFRNSLLTYCEIVAPRQTLRLNSEQTPFPNKNKYETCFYLEIRES